MTDWHGRGVALIAGAVLSLVLAACQSEPAVDGASASASFGPALVERQRAACEADGGRFGRGGAGDALVCYRQTRDANQPCRQGSDCQGLCLARSRTCSPVEPFFGCHEVLTAPGVRSTLCID